MIRKKKRRNLLEDPRYLEFCARYKDNFLDYLIDMAEHRREVPVTWQQFQLANAVQVPGCRVSVASGHGCFGKGFEVLMYDGRVKKVEDVLPGDLLMGDDSTPRCVISLKRGREAMYRFEYMDKTEHEYNASHILCLVATQSHGSQCTNDKIQVKVSDWLLWSDRRKRTHAAYRESVVFPNREREMPLIHPYVLGVWLGDGCTYNGLFTNPDKEIKDSVVEYAESEGLSISTKGKSIDFRIIGQNKVNTFVDALNSYGLKLNKHIPQRYKTGSLNERLELLAGLIDADGYLDKRNKRVFTIVQKRKVLALDIVDLARSIGIHATIRPIKKTCGNNGKVGIYYEVSLTRNIEIIPTRVPRKKADNSGLKQRGNLRFGIRSVTALGEGDYYGFTLDGNNLFLSKDFMVHRNTGKSFSLARVCDWHLRVYPKSNALLTATNIKQVSSVIWKELDGAIEAVEKNYPFLKGYFTKKAERYFQNDYKDSWYVMPKTASKGAPENLAGQHNDNYMVIVDEASAVPDEIHEVLQGALTHENNRYIMVSQPTRAAGHFYDSHHTLKDILYQSLIFNSEESPLVSLKFIRDNLIKYNGHASPEYQIRVLGHFPDNLEGFLVARQWVEMAQKIVVLHEEAWGYVMTVDVAEGMHRDSSVFNIWKVSGYGDNRRVEHVKNYNSKTVNEKAFARYLYQESLDYQDITIAVDADGPGRTVILELEELGIQCEHIRWGLPCHSKADQKRYRNQRAYASVKAREAIMSNRIRLQPGKTVVDQASRIPYKINDRGQYEIWSKERMRAEGIRSPDEFDTVCFAWLVDYIPLEAAKSQETNKYLEWAREALEGKAN